jgi:hypothetical protein
MKIDIFTDNFYYLEKNIFDISDELIDNISITKKFISYYFNIYTDFDYYLLDYEIYLESNDRYKYYNSYSKTYEEEETDFKNLIDYIIDNSKTSNFLHYICEKLIEQGEFENFNNICDTDFIIDKKYYEKIIENNSWFLEEIPKDFLTYSLCEKAISQNPEMLKYVPKKIKNYYSLVKIVYLSDKKLYNKKWFPKEYRTQLQKDLKENF